MPSINTGHVTLEYDTFGKSSDPALLLIMGFATQMIIWPDEFCEQLAKSGLFVIRHDNRDVGLSQKFDDLGKPNIAALLVRRFLGLPVSAPYSLDDMADDAVQLLDALGVARAHVVGMSMGGMIAQLMALNHPDRVISLTSWSSSAGRVTDLILDPYVSVEVLSPVPRDREKRIAKSVAFWTKIAGPKYPTPPEENRRRTERTIDRSAYIGGNGRQFAAIVAAPSRIPRLKKLRIPTLVIHGDADRLCPPRAGRAVARAIPNARLMMIEGYGHDLPMQLLPRIRDAIVEHARAAEPARGTREAILQSEA